MNITLWQSTAMNGLSEKQLLAKVSLINCVSNKM